MEVVRHRDMMANEYITLDSNSYRRVKTFKYLGLNTYFFSNLSKHLKIKIYIKQQYCHLCYMVVKHGLLH